MKQLAVLAMALALLLAPEANALFITFEAAGPDPAAIVPTRDAFRAAVGGGNLGGAGGSFGGLWR